MRACTIRQIPIQAAARADYVYNNTIQEKRNPIVGEI